VRIIYTNAYLAVHKPKQAKIQTSVSKEKAVSFLNLEEKMEENKIEKTNEIFFDWRGSKRKKIDSNKS